MRQDIVKPVVQDVHETIVPFRRITQELKPVQESVHQILPRGQERGFYQQQQQVRVAQHVAAPAAVAVQPVVQAAPAISAVRVAAAPAVAYAAPAVSTVSAAPAAIGVIGVQPAAGYIGYGAGYGTGYGVAKYGTGYGLTSGLIGGGSYGSSYSVQPASYGTGYGYTTYSSDAYPIRKK